MPPLADNEVAAAEGLTPIDPSALEARDLASGADAATLQRRALANRHEREERFYDLVEKVGRVFIWLAAISIGALGLTYALHLILPDRMLWKTPEQISRIQALLSSAVFSSLVTSYFARRLNRPTTRNEDE